MSYLSGKNLKNMSTNNQITQVLPNREHEIDIKSYIGKEVIANLFPPFMTQVVVTGLTFDEGSVILTDSENKFSVNMPVDDFYSRCAPTSLSRAVEGSSILDIANYPEQEIVVVRTVWSNTEKDREYLEYCKKIGRDLKEVRVKKTINPKVSYEGIPSDDIPSDDIIF